MPLKRSIVFLQGPLGPFFRALAAEFSCHGYVTHKINFNGGDQWFSGADHCFDYRGTEQQWPQFLENYLKDFQIQAVFLLGDCRLYHRLARPVCDKLGVQFMVFEEGYLRPDTITLEQGGVNAFTAMDLSPAALAAASRHQRKADVTMSPTMKRRTLYASAYYWAARLRQTRFPAYQHHRAFSPVVEGAKWIRGAWRKYQYKHQDKATEQRLTGALSRQFFLVALQVHDDSQMRFHSHYDSVEAFIGETIASFAAGASAADYLVFKHHPMDRGYTCYQSFIHQQARQCGIEKRVIYCHDVSLPALYHHTKGVVPPHQRRGNRQ